MAVTWYRRRSCEGCRMVTLWFLAWVPGWIVKPFTKMAALERSRFESKKRSSILLIR